MPGMSGLDLATALAADETTAGTPIVLLSSSGGERDIESARRAGIATSMAKPVRRERFRRCLVDLLAGPAPEVPGATTSYNQNLWIDHPFEGAAYLPR